MRLTLMTYNLLYGSHERDGGSLVRREERAAAAREVILAEAPDVLGLTEAVFIARDGAPIRDDFAAHLGMPHVRAAGFPGEWANCVVSRHPIAHAERIPLGATEEGAPISALRAVIDCGDRRLHVDVCHPSPKVLESERAAAFAPLVESAGRPYVLMGDFNALSDEDPYDPAVLVAELAGNVPEPLALATRMMDRQLIAALRARGLRDAMPVTARRHTLPTRLSRPHATQGARLRIDYVFVSEEIGVERAGVVWSEEADRASDHYPVVAILTI
jgi:endonuclease/exonuclease/phosphatase family metal-dependent hydrolase